MKKQKLFSTRKKLLRSILAFFFFAYAFICSYFYIYQNKLLFHPEDVERYHAPSLEAYERFHTSDNTKLHGWHVHTPGTRKPLLVYFGGNSENIEKTVEHYKDKTEHRYDILAFEYRGFGMSEGTPNEASLVQDGIHLVHAFMASHGYTNQDIVVIGRSLGTGVAVQVASALQPKAIILVTPYDSINAVAEYTYPYVPIRYLNVNSFLSDRYAPDLSIHGLWIIAEHDAVTPAHHGRRLAQLMGTPPTIVTLHSATHGNVYEFATTWEHIKKFLKQELGV